MFRIPEQAVADIYPPKGEELQRGAGLLSAGSHQTSPRFVPTDNTTDRHIFTIRILGRHTESAAAAAHRANFSIGNQEIDQDSRFLCFKDELIAVQGYAK